MKNSSKLSAWLINSLDIPFKRYDTSEIKQRYQHLNGIEFPPQRDLHITILIGIDHADHLLPREICGRRDGEPMPFSTKSGWLLMGASKHNKREGSLNCLCDNSRITLTKTFKTSAG